MCVLGMHSVTRYIHTQIGRITQPCTDQSNYLLLLLVHVCTSYVFAMWIVFFPLIFLYDFWTQVSDADLQERYQKSNPINMNISCNTLVNTTLWSRDARTVNGSISIKRIVHLAVTSGRAKCTLYTHQIRMLNGKQIPKAKSVHHLPYMYRNVRRSSSRSICQKYYFNYGVCVCVCASELLLLCTYWTNFANRERHSINRFENIQFYINAKSPD